MNLYLQFLLFVFAGWVNRHQQAVIEYLQAENQALREQLGNKRIRWTDAQRRRLAERAKAIGRSALHQLGTAVTPDTLLRWYRQLIAAKYDGSKQRGPGGPQRSWILSALSSAWRKKIHPGATRACAGRSTIWAIKLCETRSRTSC